MRFRDRGYEASVVFLSLIPSPPRTESKPVPRPWPSLQTKANAIRGEPLERFPLLFSKQML